MCESLSIWSDSHGKRTKMNLIAVYIPCKDKEEAKKITKHLLDKKLIACAGMWPIESFYMWKGELRNDKEYTILAKSTDEKFEDMKKEIKGIHSYEIPAIVKFKIETNEDYEKWLTNEVNQ